MINFLTSQKARVELMSVVGNYRSNEDIRWCQYWRQTGVSRYASYISVQITYGDIFSYFQRILFNEIKKTHLLLLLVGHNCWDFVSNVVAQDASMQESRLGFDSNYCTSPITGSKYHDDANAALVVLSFFNIMFETPRAKVASLCGKCGD